MPFFSSHNGDFGSVTLDGVELKEVIKCDTDKGFAVIYRTDDAGNLVIDGEDIATDTVYGVIDFTPALDCELNP